MPDTSCGQKLALYALGAHQISKCCVYEYPMELIFSLKHFYFVPGFRQDHAQMEDERVSKLTVLVEPKSEEEDEI